MALLVFLCGFLGFFLQDYSGLFGAYLKAIWKVFLGCCWSFCTGLLLSLIALTLVGDLSTHFSAFYLDLLDFLGLFWTGYICWLAGGFVLCFAGLILHCFEF